MRENRTHGSEGGDGVHAVSDPYRIQGSFFRFHSQWVFSKEDTKVSDNFYPNFVLFVPFVVSVPFQL